MKQQNQNSQRFQPLYLAAQKNSDEKPVSLNKGIVKGDINVGGIAGAMAIDEENLEDDAAGSTQFSPGDSYTTKCIISSSTNQGYVMAKKHKKTAK